jgi:hypothetical protein
LLLFPLRSFRPLLLLPRLGLRLRPRCRLWLRSRRWRLHPRRCLGLRPGLYLGSLLLTLYLLLLLALALRQLPLLHLSLLLLPLKVLLPPLLLQQLLLSLALLITLLLLMLWGLARSPAALQSLVFLFLLSPLLRRQAPVPLGQGRCAGLRSPRRGEGPCWRSAGARGPRVKFAPLYRSGWCGRWLSLGAGLEPSWFGLTGGLPVHLCWLGGDHGLPWPRSGRYAGLAMCGSRRGCRCRFKGLRFARDKPLPRGQLMNLLGHLRGQWHGSPGW